MDRRVVITGLGVVAPNAHGLDNYEKALRAGKSGITFQQKLKDLNFACNVGGVPEGIKEIANQYFSDEELLAMNEGMTYGGIACVDAWKDAGLELPDSKSDYVNWDSGCILGVGLGGMDTISDKVIPMIAAGKVRRMGSTMVEQTMASGVSAKMSGKFALGNEVTTNSSACNTGLEAIIMSYYRIKYGLAEKMLAGGVEGSAVQIWGGFDSMKVLCSKYNDTPEKASRPMSATAAGFIPGSGSGVVLVESLESAQKRGARIYAEIIGAHVNCGGHRMGGSMTAPNPVSVQRCIQGALKESGIKGTDIDAINGHLTGTFADPYEVNNWAKALEVEGDKLPYIQSTKSMIGHCLGAAGSVEAVAALLELTRGFLHKSLNCEDLHPNIQPFEKKVVRETIDKELNIIAKASFGFGDVNGCVLFKKWK